MLNMRGAPAQQPDAFDRALQAIASVRADLRNGVRHYDRHWRLLTSEIGIITAASRFGPVRRDLSAMVMEVDPQAVLTELRATHRRH